MRRLVWYIAPILIAVGVHLLGRWVTQALSGLQYGSDLTAYVIPRVGWTVTTGAIVLICYRCRTLFGVAEPSLWHSRLWPLLACGAVPTAVAVGGLVQYLATWIMSSAGLQFPQPTTTAAITPYSELTRLVFVVVTTPIMEEVLHRSILFPAMVQRYGRAWAYILSASMFWLAHPLASVYTLGAALVFILVLEITGRVEASIIAHAGMNLLSLLPAAGLAHRLVLVISTVCLLVVVWQASEMLGPRMRAPYHRVG